MNNQIPYTFHPIYRIPTITTIYYIPIYHIPYKFRTMTDDRMCIVFRARTGESCRVQNGWPTFLALWLVIRVRCKRTFHTGFILNGRTGRMQFSTRVPAIVPYLLTILIIWDYKRAANFSSVFDMRLPMSMDQTVMIFRLLTWGSPCQ